MVATSIRTRLAAVAAAAALAAGCESSTSVGTGQVTVLLKDAPMAGIQSAEVTISQVYLIGGNDESGPRFDIPTAAGTYNLLELQGDVNANLGTVTIPAGTYTQMRFIVDEATLTLASGSTFSDGTDTKALKVPSGMQTGIKVTFSSPLVITEGGHSILVADMNVARNFVFTGPPSAPTGVLFTPVIQATGEAATGSITGTVTFTDLSKVKVFAVLNNDTVATAAPNGTSGVYLLPFLAPAQYVVGALNTTNTPGSLIGLAKSATVEAGKTVTVDFP